MLLVNSVAPDQTARMRRLIWGYTVRKCDKGPFLIKRLNYYQHCSTTKVGIGKLHL